MKKSEKREKYEKPTLILWRTYGYSSECKIKGIKIKLYAFRALDGKWGWQVYPTNLALPMANGLAASVEKAMQAAEDQIKKLKAMKIEVKKTPKSKANKKAR